MDSDDELLQKLLDDVESTKKPAAKTAALSSLSKASGMSTTQSKAAQKKTAPTTLGTGGDGLGGIQIRVAARSAGPPPPAPADDEIGIQIRPVAAPSTKSAGAARQPAPYALAGGGDLIQIRPVVSAKSTSSSASARASRPPPVAPPPQAEGPIIGIRPVINPMLAHAPKSPTAPAPAAPYAGNAYGRSGGPPSMTQPVPPPPPPPPPSAPTRGPFSRGDGDFRAPASGPGAAVAPPPSSQHHDPYFHRPAPPAPPPAVPPPPGHPPQTSAAGQSAASSSTPGKSGSSPCGNPRCRVAAEHQGEICRFSRYCSQCRFTAGDPFRPAKRLLGLQTASRGNKQLVFEVPVYPATYQYPITGAGIQLGGGLGLQQSRCTHELELRCVPAKPVHYKDELSHRWPESGVSVSFSGGPNFSDRRILKLDAVHGEDTIAKEDNVPLNLTKICDEAARNYVSQQPFVAKLRVILNLRGNEGDFALGLMEMDAEVKAQTIVNTVQRSQTVPAHVDRARAIKWVEDHLPAESADEDGVAIVDPPAMALTCPMSMLRIGIAARGRSCIHLQSFDLENYVQTMKLAPPKRKWVCPICDLVCLPQQLVLDSFAQRVLDETKENVTEVLISTAGDYTASKVEEDLGDDDGGFSSDEEGAGAFGRAGGGPPAQGTSRTTKLAAEVKLTLRSRAPPGGSTKTSAAPAGGATPATTVARKNPQGRGAGAGAPRGSSADASREQLPAKREELERQRREQDAIERERRRREWEKLQFARYGWMEDGEACDYCGKAVQFHGGVVCGRPARTKQESRGCGKKTCWKCFRNLRDKNKTTKAECEALGEGLWWMHDKCMNDADRRAYYGEEASEEPVTKKQRKDSGDRFAWE